MQSISCHAWYRVRRGTFIGYVRVQDGSVTHTISTTMRRTNRVDALADAAGLADDIRRTNRNAFPQERGTV